MTQVLPVDLTYGHPGEASYDGRGHGWTFSRDLGADGRQFQLIYETIASHNQPVGPSACDIKTTYTRSKNVKCLAKDFPDLVPAAPRLSAWAHRSENVENWDTSFDPHRSDLLAYGEIPANSEGTSSTQNVRIAAVAGGSCGDVLKLVRLSKVRYTWESPKRAQLSSSSFQHGAESTWTGGFGPIQQLCFSRQLHSEHTHWLAVRYPTATIILQLSITSGAPDRRPYPGVTTQVSASSSESKACAIEGHAIVTLHIHHGGGIPHADICFSPWNDRHLGIVDENGHWSIWAFDAHVQRPEIWEATRLATGVVSQGSQSDAEAVDSSHSEWYRILWMNPNTILIGSKDQIARVQFGPKAKSLLSAPDLVLSDNGEQILDMKACPLNTGHVAILTSLRILWLGIDARTGFHGEDAAPPMKSVLAWRHFRDPGDYSLRLSMLRNGNEVTVVLYSKVKHETILYTFLIPSAPNEVARVIHNPCMLASDQATIFFGEAKKAKQSPGQVPFLTTVLDSLPHRVSHRRRSIGSVSVNGVDSAQYYQLTVLRKDLSVSEMLLVSQPTTAVSRIQLPINRKIIDEPVAEAFTRSHFIAFGNNVEPVIPSHLKESAVRRTFGNSHDWEDPWTLNLTWLPKELMSAGKTNFKEALNFIKSIIEQDASEDSHLPRSLAELVDAPLYVEDVDVASDELADLFRTLETVKEEGVEQRGSEARVGTSLTASTCQAWGLHEGIGLSRVYDMLISHWLRPLSPEAPGRARVAVERTARAVSAHLSLAAHQYPAPMSYSIENPVEVGHVVENSDFVLPLRRRRSATGLSEKGKEKVPPTEPSLTKVEESKGALPTPDPTPSIRSGSLPASMRQTESLASQRLRSLVQMRPQAPHTNATTAILGYWDEGTNPWTDEPEASQQILSADSETQDVGESSQRKRPKEGERPHKRSRLGTFVAASQPEPTRIASSHPQADPTVETQGSSQVAAPMILSQVEPGAHGGRLSLRSKKKSEKRKAGFK